MRENPESKIQEGGPTGGLRICGSKIQNPEPGLGDSAWESRGQDHRSKIQRGLPCSEGEQGGVKITDPESKSGLEREGEDRREKMRGN